MKFKKIISSVGVLALSVILMGQGCLTVGKKQPTLSGSVGVFASTDGGDAWKQVSLLPTTESTAQISASVYKIAEDPQDPKAFYWGSRENGLFFTYDNGKTWQKVSGSLASGFIYDVVVDPFDSCTVFATNGLIVYKSEDCNRNWKEIYRESRADIKVLSLEHSYQNKNEMFLATSNGDLLKSSDNGATWGTLNRFNVRLGEIKADKIQKDALYVASRKNGLYVSKDGGKTWSLKKDLINDFKEGLNYRSLHIHPTKANTIYWVSDYGILVSENAGETFSDMELITTPGTVNIYGFDINPKNPKEIYYTASAGLESTLYKSVDGGITWTTKQLPSGQMPTAMHIHSEIDNLIYVGFSVSQ